MSQSLVRNYQHIVFSTKSRAPFLSDSSTRLGMHAYLAGICRNLDSPAVIVGGVADHVHLLCLLSKSMKLEDFVRDLKRNSSKWARSQSEACSSFYWQTGYGAFSISPSHVESLRAYIARQEAHHCKVSFQEEFRRLLTKYGIEWDEALVWD
ncbi:MAG: transposase [Candidatus Sumerlaeia bacterium]|nr:transposase [Candidatus Sumerlaeia bacterium]